MAAAAAAVVAFAIGGVVLATRTPANTGEIRGGTAVTAGSAGVTITSGACSGGGTAFCYTPESLTVAQGTMVTWTNMSGVSHTATSCTSAACPGAPANTGSNTFNVSIAAASGSTASFTFTKPGRYTYYCTIHGYTLMHGMITVIAKPKIKSVAPTSGPVGTTVTITGAHLAGATRVTFNGTAATVTTDTSSKIVTRVPAGATTGTIKVTTPGGTATSTQTFTVTGATAGITITSGSCGAGGTSFCYSPESLSIASGTTVMWTNMSGVGHTATVCDSTDCPGAPANTGANTFSVSIGAANGSTGSFTFTSAGSYTYYCAIHGYAAMNGTITVT